MALLPTKNLSEHSLASSLAEVKKGNKQALGDFVWQNQERFYIMSLFATGNHETATVLTLETFQRAIKAIATVNPRQLGNSAWGWLSDHAVAAIADYHLQYSAKPVPKNANPEIDGSAEVDWMKTTILGTQRLKRCLNLLPELEMKAFVLRHQVDLNYEQIASVLNEDVDTVMAWTYRARVELIKCLSRG